MKRNFLEVCYKHSDSTYPLEPCRKVIQAESDLVFLNSLQDIDYLLKNEDFNIDQLSILNEEEEKNNFNKLCLIENEIEVLIQKELENSFKKSNSRNRYEKKMNKRYEDAIRFIKIFDN